MANEIRLRNPSERIMNELTAVKATMYEKTFTGVIERMILNYRQRDKDREAALTERDKLQAQVKELQRKQESIRNYMQQSIRYFNAAKKLAGKMGQK